MDQLLSTLGNALSIRVVEHLLGLDQDPPSPRHTTQSEMRAAFGIPDSRKATLSKAVRKLAEAGLVAESAGPRTDQPLVALRQVDKLQRALAAIADLDATLAADRALLAQADAEIKADRAARLMQSRSRQH